MPSQLKEFFLLFGIRGHVDGIDVIKDLGKEWGVVTATLTVADNMTVAQ
mgnify:CR=1 FL=1